MSASPQSFGQFAFGVTPFAVDIKGSLWNVTPWGGVNSYSLQRNWIGCNGVGYAASGRLAFAIQNIAVQWQSIDYLFEEGGPL